MNKQSLSLSQLQASTSWIDFKHFEDLIFKSNDIKIQGVKETYSRKLFKFGLHHARENLTADQVIFNLSDKHLTTDEKEVLSHGLKFALPPKKLNYHHHFLNFEKLYNELEKILSTINCKMVFTELRLLSKTLPSNLTINSRISVFIITSSILRP